MQNVSTNYLRTLFLEHESANLRRVVTHILVKNFLMKKKKTRSENIALYYMFMLSATFTFNVVVLPC